MEPIDDPKAGLGSADHCAGQEENVLEALCKCGAGKGSVRVQSYTLDSHDVLDSDHGNFPGL